MSTGAHLIPAERIERRILLVRGQKVLLDFQLAELYGVATKTLNQAVKRNAERFPEDFMFQLNEEEAELVLRSQIVTSGGGNWSQTVTSSTATAAKSMETAPGRWSQIVTTSEKYRRATHRPYAFTGQGVAMLSSVLRSPRAVQVNIAIMRTFVQLRQMLASHAGLAHRLEELEKQYDAQFKAVFDAIRALMEPEPRARGEIGFHTTMIPRATASRGRRMSPNPS